MKKQLCVLLALVMMLCLCACDKNQGGQSPAGGETTTMPEQTQQTTTAPEVETTAPTVHEHTYTEQITKEATCADKGEKTFICACGDSHTEEIEKTAHKYSKATCTAPKTCSACGKTEGKAASHNYVGGKCTICGGAQKDYKALTAGRWRVYVVYSEYQMEELTLNFNKDGTGYFGVSVYGREQNMTDPDKVVIDDVTWYEEGFGYGSDEMTYKEEDNTITVNIDGRGEKGKIVLTRTAGNKLKVKSVSGTIIDDQITKETKAGTVYKFVK